MLAKTARVVLLIFAFKGMYPNWLGIISAVLAFAAFFVVYRAVQSRSFQCRIAFTCVALLAAIPGLSFAVYYAHLLPEADWYYQFRSIAGTELLVVFVGIASGAIATLLPRVALMLPLFGAAVCSIAPVIKPIAGPLPDGMLKDRWVDGVCMQTSASTCGPASAATIVKYLGGQATESELASDAHSYVGGTEAWYLARAVRSLGYDVHFDIGSGSLIDADLPAVVGVRMFDSGHFIAMLGQEGDHFIVGDPILGRELLSLAELEQRYVFTGFQMRIKKR